MNKGAFAMLDCLGFKGFWARHPKGVENLAAFLQKMQAAVTAILKEQELFISPRITTELRFLSDTVIISAKWNLSAEENPLDADEQEALLILSTVSSCVAVIKHFSSRRLLLRGHVTYGPHEIVDNFIIGEAVDRAAELAEISDGAFIWLSDRVGKLALNALNVTFSRWQRDVLEAQRSPLGDRATYCVKRLKAYPVLRGGTLKGLVIWWNALQPNVQATVAEKVIERSADFNRRDFLLPDFEMPIKGRGNLRCVVVNPLVRVARARWQDFCSTALATFNTDSIDVMLKKQHTQRLLEHASKVSQDDYARRRAALLTLIETLEEGTCQSFPGPRNEFDMQL